MAKRRVNKAAKIREALAANPQASVKEIIALLAAQRVKVVSPQVYAIRAKMGSAEVTSAPADSSPAKPKAKKKTDQFAALIQAKKLADAMGGVDKARAALDILAQIL
jgi:hypothetical protein